MRVRQIGVSRVSKFFSLALMLALAGCGRPADRAAKPAVEAKPDATPPPAIARLSAEERAELSTALYGRHCAACHGDRGDGKGLAATFLYPKPRDLRAGHFRLVSTENGVPTPDDLHAVIQRGMPGSSMPPWAHLSEEERQLLVEAVLALRREGALDVERELAEEAGDELTEEELTEAVVHVLQPGRIFEVPEADSATEEIIQRGRALYQEKGCASCHGAEGKGDGQQQMVDVEGLPTRPRDLTLGIYKGNTDFDSVYRRLALGMPGSPMPASQNLDAQQIADLVHFVLSLSDEATREVAVLKRRSIESQAVAAAPERPDDPVWDSAAAVTIQTVPLWWRDEEDVGLVVQALHDGTMLAIRLTWRDATADTSAAHADEFDDKVALQLYQGDAEPFLGMGAESAAIDLWQWRAGTHETGDADYIADDYPFDMPVYQQFFVDGQMPDFLTARAVGNPLAKREHEAANLVATGFGTTTFRPEPSQVVEAVAAYEDGQWSVVFRRPLAVSAGDGVTLEPGEKYSIAFAVWDGVQRDRAAQKRISVWNDFAVRQLPADQALDVKPQDDPQAIVSSSPRKDAAP